MRLTADQAFERLMYEGTGMRRAKGEPLHLLDMVRSSRQDRLFLFGGGGGIRPLRQLRGHPTCE
jgi:hypothetical protein